MEYRMAITVSVAMGALLIGGAILKDGQVRARERSMRAEAAKMSVDSLAQAFRKCESYRVSDRYVRDSLRCSAVASAVVARRRRVHSANRSPGTLLSKSRPLRRDSYYPMRAVRLNR
jgi:hypothetical protein